MGLYNVIQPCVVEGRHYVRPITQPIEVDDDEAAELVESGCLTPYQPGAATVDPESAEASHVSTDHEGTAVGDPSQDPLPTGDFAPAEPESGQTPESPSPRPRRRIPEE